MKEPWNRAHKLALIAICIALTVGILGVVAKRSDGDAAGADSSSADEVTTDSAPNSCKDEPDDPPQLGGGPQRAALREKPSDYPVFNSADREERAFASGGVFFDGQPPLEMSRNVEVKEGQSVLVQLLIKNNGADGVAYTTAQGSRVTVGMPDCFGRQLGLTAFINTINTEPQQIWANLRFISADKFTLNYEPATARLCNIDTPCTYTDGNSYESPVDGGVRLSTALFSSGGTSIGSYELNGDVGGQEEVSIYFVVRPLFL